MEINEYFSRKVNWSEELFNTIEIKKITKQKIISPEELDPHNKSPSWSRSPQNWMENFVKIMIKMRGRNEDEEVIPCLVPWTSLFIIIIIIFEIWTSLFNCENKINLLKFGNNKNIDFSMWDKFWCNVWKFSHFWLKREC